MNKLRILAIVGALVLIFMPDLFALLAQGSTYGNPLQRMASTDRTIVLFWSAVVFLFYFFRFQTWPASPPAEFAHTPPSHCTTRSRYLLAQMAYVGTILGAFWVLSFVPQLFDLLRQAIGVLGQGGTVVSPAFSDPDLQGQLARTATPLSQLGPAEAAPYIAAFLLLVYPRFEVLGEPAVRAFFQDRAMIPSEAREHIDLIGDARDAKSFKPI